jgi:hypothetical protein
VPTVILCIKRKVNIFHKLFNVFKIWLCYGTALMEWNRVIYKSYEDNTFHCFCVKLWFCPEDNLLLIVQYTSYCMSVSSSSCHSTKHLQRTRLLANRLISDNIFPCCKAASPSVLLQPYLTRVLLSPSPIYFPMFFVWWWEYFIWC